MTAVMTIMILECGGIRGLAKREKNEEECRAGAGGFTVKDSVTWALLP